VSKNLKVLRLLATLRPLRRGRQSFLNHVKALSALFASQLATMQFRKIRIKGLAIGLELPSEREATRMVKRAAELGLLLSSQDTTILLLPPLTISKNLAAEGLSILRACA